MTPTWRWKIDGHCLARFCGQYSLVILGASFEQLLELRPIATVAKGKKATDMTSLYQYGAVGGKEKNGEIYRFSLLSRRVFHSQCVR